MSLVFVAELFDKTFFVAMLLAMRTSKLFAFNSSVAALGVMSFISAGLGSVVGKLPFISRTFFGLAI
jgi:putative Ca2+/H+ antiporter (TMEM165/GDT1 family)